MKIPFPVIRFQPDIRNQIMIRKCLLHLCHPIEYNFPCALRFPICTDIDVTIFVK